MVLTRVYAFQVVPQHGVKAEERTPPGGGVVPISDALRDVFAKTKDKTHESVLMPVDFAFDEDRDAHPVRKDLMTVAFEKTTAPKAAAARLAARLSGVMDNRSQAGLMLLTVEGEDDRRRVSVLLLPREDVVQWTERQRDEIVLELLENAFSTGSGLRKAAVVEGRNIKTNFLGARIIDLQLTSGRRAVASFWVDRFLLATLKITPELGSRELADGLRRAFDAVKSDDDRDGVMGAIYSVRAGHVKVTSIEKFADKTMPDGVRDAFVRGISEDVMQTPFTVDRAVVNARLGIHVIETKDRVVIMAPPEAIGTTVKIEKRGSAKVVAYSGLVDAEHMKAAPAVRETKKKGKKDDASEAEGEAAE